MNLFSLIALIGLTMGVLACGAAALYHRIARRAAQRSSDGRVIGRTAWGSTGIGGLPTGAALIAQVGEGAGVRRSLDAVIMRPTLGLRMMSIVPSALVLWLVWGPSQGAVMPSEWGQLALTAGVIYALCFVNGYEARYDGEGITAPDWLFQPRHYRWSDLVMIRDDGHYLYRLTFADGRRLSLQKYLVGIRTFLTFVSDIEDMHART